MPPAMKQESIPLFALSDLVLGHLSPEDSLKLLDEIEKDPRASADLEFVIGLLNFARQNPVPTESNRNTM